MGESSCLHGGGWLLNIKVGDKEREVRNGKSMGNQLLLATCSNIYEMQTGSEDINDLNGGFQSETSGQEK